MSRAWHGYWPKYRERVTPADGQLVRLTSGDPAVSLEEAKQWLRVESDDEDAVVERAIRAVQDQLVPPDGWLGRALTTVEFRLDLPCFGDTIVIPAPPLRSIEKFRYRDLSGDMQDVDTDLWRVTDAEPAMIVRKRDKRWPDDVDHSQPDAIQVEFEAGYGEAGDVPEVIQQWILYQVTQIHDIRNPVLVGTIAGETPFIRNMLESWRVKV